ncbi:hypothetical protein [Actinokineospora sp. HUAS TT18]|uniref:hypothetical protein n=1 Tax=Actinokineospora sp. HUAS TT18 TaxID=3447451 RepID=UPI003F51B96C
MDLEKRPHTSKLWTTRSPESMVLDVGEGVSALWLRAVIAAASGGILLDIALHNPAPVPLIFAAFLALASTVIPSSPAPLLLILTAAATLTATIDTPFAPGVLLLIPLVHLLHLSTAIAALLPRKARIAPKALKPPLKRAAGTQAIVWLIAIIGAGIPDGRVPMILEVAGLLSIAS